ncbi:MAG TPA: hypothetical protein VFY13_00735, partial [Luteolibacter sp.]|nr:hypothetical protein [Luteolibacter sp.]
PPYGLRWGDSPEKLISWAQEHGYDITTTIPGKQPGLRIIRIAPEQGLIAQSKASAIEGRFLAGRLYEMTVDYSDPAAGAEAIATRFEELKRQITREYGPLLANQQQRSVNDQFATRTESFHREPLKGLFLLLAYTEVEDLLRKTKDARFSLIYRNDNFRKELEAALQEKP